MLDKLLSFNPTTRMVVEEAMAHPFMAEYYDPNDEPVAKKPFQFEVTKFCAAGLMFGLVGFKSRF